MVLTMTPKNQALALVAAQFQQSGYYISYLINLFIYSYLLRSAMQTAKYRVMTIIDKWMRYKYYFCQ